MNNTVGVALGGGGAKGLAHIAMLEVLDELDARPVVMSGTSIGAIIGTMYASGMPARDIRSAIHELTALPQSITEAWESKRLLGWMDLLAVEIGQNNLLSADTFLQKLEALLGLSRFEELNIPIKIVATDFWAREEIVFDSGSIIPAVAASFCLPGVFKPTVLEGRVLVDGGCVNPVPFDLVQGHCDITVAVDVLGTRLPTGDDLEPSYTDAVFNTFQIAEKTIVNEKLKVRRPDIYLEPPIRDVKVLEFHKADEIYSQSEPECRRLAAELKALL